MITLSRAALLASATLLLGLSQAHAAATVNVTCSATKKIQTAIDNAAAGNPTTINISGNCVENLTIPYGKIIIIKGSLASATITAKDVTQNAVVSRGDTTIQNVLLQNTGPASGNIADTVAEAEDGGVLRLYGDRLEGGAGADAVVGVYDHGTAYIYNSRVSGGASEAIDSANAASVLLGSNTSTVQGPDGYTSNINNDVFCGPGSSLFIRIRGTSGKMAINAANYAGVSTNQCSLNIWNKTSSIDNLTITGGGQYGPGIALNKSTLSLTNTKITGSPGAGIDALASSATIQRSAFIGNGTQSGRELKAGPGSMLYVQASQTPNDIPSAYTGQAFECWPYPADGGTSATSGQIVVETSGVTVPSGSASDAMVANNTCVTYLP